MQENNQTEKNSVSGEPVKAVVPEVKSETEVTTPQTEVTTTVPAETTTTAADVTAEVATETAATTSPVAAAPTSLSPLVKKYALAALVVVVIGLLLLFGLERQGRIDTNFFGQADGAPAALVNDVEIKKADFDSSVAQLLDIAQTQGQDVTDPLVVEQFEAQAIETLISGELLRQAALEAGMEATPDAIDARFLEIETGVGGPEVLATRMAEFGINEDTLRRDIENEILIQGLFDTVLGLEAPEVTEEEIVAFYEGLGDIEGLPPLDEVRTQVAEQIRLERQQEEIGAYIETLRADATVEILI